MSKFIKFGGSIIDKEQITYIKNPLGQREGSKGGNITFSHILYSLIVGTKSGTEFYETFLGSEGNLLNERYKELEKIIYECDQTSPRSS